MTRKVLVTGGAGFIGSHLTEALVNRGDLVRVVDNLSTGSKNNLAAVQDEIEFFQGDIRDQSLIKTALKDVDYVFHQAAFVSVPLSIEQPDQCFDVNVSGTVQLMSAARTAGVKRLVIASSAAVYGDVAELPLQEEGTIQPLSPYAVSKRVGELYAELFSNELGIEVVALRYFNIYGPRQSPSSDYAAVIPIFVQRLSSGSDPTIFGDGKQTRDFIYVDDVVRANLLAADSDRASGLAVNVCSGQETSILDVFEILNSIFNVKRQATFQDQRPGDIYRSVGDPTRAEAVISFHPSVNLSQGLEKTVSWMVDQSAK